MHDDESLLILSKIERDLIYRAITAHYPDAYEDEKPVLDGLIRRLERLENP